MQPLDKDLQSTKNTLSEFKDLSVRVLEYMPNIISDYEDKTGYRIFSSEIAGTKKYVRPINNSLFITEPELLSESFDS